MKLPFTYHRKAIAMIELIFAIVVMGIVMLSAPMMLTTATKSSTVAFQQESIAIAATHANSLLTYAWDEANTDTAFGSTLSILSTQSPITALDRNDTRAMIPAMLRYKSSIPTFASPAANFTADTDTIRDDVDDFNGASNSLRLTTYGAGSSSGEDEYMDTTVTLATQVFYGKDRASSPNFNGCSSTTGCAFSNPFTAAAIPPGGTTNVKYIQTTLTSTNAPDKNIVLKAFVCNIGSAIARKKIF